MYMPGVFPARVFKLICLMYLAILFVSPIWPAPQYGLLPGASGSLDWYGCHANPLAVRPPRARTFCAYSMGEWGENSPNSTWAWGSARCSAAWPRVYSWRYFSG